MAYSNGRLYVSGGMALDRQETHSKILSLVRGLVLLTKGGRTRVCVHEEPDMLYARNRHRMVG